MIWKERGGKMKKTQKPRKNKKTGAVVEVRSELSGGDWEKIAPKTIKKTTSKTAERKSAVKKDE
mgnify:CR=1 FL=1